LLWQRNGETVRAAVHMWDAEAEAPVVDEYELGESFASSVLVRY